MPHAGSLCHPHDPTLEDTNNILRVDDFRRRSIHAEVRADVEDTFVLKDSLKAWRFVSSPEAIRES